MSQLSLNVPDDLMRSYLAMAQARGMSLSAFVRDCVYTIAVEIHRGGEVKLKHSPRSALHGRQGFPPKPAEQKSVAPTPADL